jgi:hypothetical protein
MSVPLHNESARQNRYPSGLGAGIIIARGNLPKRLAGPQGKERPMGAERQVMQDYIDALVKRADFARYFTEDVVASLAVLGATE